MAEDIGKKVERFGQDLWKKTQGVFGSVSKNTEIAAKKRELSKLYEEIGRQYCALHAAEAENEFPALCEKVAGFLREIDALEAELLTQKGNKKCVSCGFVIDADAQFCPSCGVKQPEPEPEPEPEPAAEAPAGWICPACHASMEESALFCSVCGAKRA